MTQTRISVFCVISTYDWFYIWLHIVANIIYSLSRLNFEEVFIHHVVYIINSAPLHIVPVLSHIVR
jgi:hypothetical protein